MAGALSQSAMSLFTQAIGAKSGFPEFERPVQNPLIQCYISLQSRKRHYTLSGQAHHINQHNIIAASTNHEKDNRSRVEVIKGEESTKKEKTKHANIDKESAKLKAEGVHLLGAELVLLLPHGLPLAIILEEPRS